MSEREMDALTLTVIWNGIMSIAEELGDNPAPYRISEGVREGDDFSTAIFDRDGRMIAQGNFSPGHLGSMPFVAQHVRDYFPEENLSPGDAIALNDLFMGSGHFPDVFQVMPVFLDGSIIGYVATSAHQVDMGGAAPGSQKVHGVTESYQEGLRILPVAGPLRRIRRGHSSNNPWQRADAGQSAGRPRRPARSQPDRLGRLCQLHRDHGTEFVERAHDIILDRTEAHILRKGAERHL